VTCICENCKEPFEKKTSEFNRSSRLGRKHFCKLSCSISFSNSHPSESRRESQKQNTKQLVPGNRKDLNSPFKTHFKSVQYRIKYAGKTGNATLDDLRNQWELQGGLCPFTKLPMSNYDTTKSRNKFPVTPYRASLDRADSTKGYDADNIQFISLMANYAKHSFTSQELIDFCHAVAQAHPRSHS